MITGQEWLPVGSVVRLVEGERPIMIAGFMAEDGETGLFWDYVGYPYPEGRQKPEDYFFNKDMIEEIHLLGYMDGMGCLFQGYLDEQTEAYEQRKRQQALLHGDELSMQTDAATSAAQ